MAARKIDVRVESDFRDKRSKCIHRAGDVISVTEKRFAEIQAKDARLVSVIESETGDASQEDAGNEPETGE